MDFISMLLSILILLGGIAALINGDVKFSKTSKSLRSKTIARFIGIIFIIAGLSFLAVDLDLGHELRLSADEIFGGRMEHLFYMIGDAIDDYAYTVAFVSTIAGLLFTFLAPKLKVENDQIIETPNE